MPPLWTRDALLQATGGRLVGEIGASIGSISIDSRELGPEALFVAIKGDRFDGHDFVNTALANGAAAALVGQGRVAAERCIVVGDPLEGLRQLARAARARSGALVVGVTGSVGKTTTKEAIRTVLQAAGPTHASIKSFNNHWGVPLMLARMPAETDFGVFEMGMNAAGEISPLSRLVRPHIAVITNVAAAHLENLGSLEAIAAAKAEIFDGLEPGGTAVLNADHPQIGMLLAAAKAAGVERVITYGFGADCDWRITELDLHAEGSTAAVEHAGEQFTINLQVPGRHMVVNAVAALVVSSLAGMDRDQAIAALTGFGAQPGRGQRLLLGDAERPILLIDESYNANTASMSAALDMFAAQPAPGGSKAVVLGDMLELGAQSPQLHASLADAVLRSGADRIYLVGTHMQALAEALGEARVAAHTQTASEMAEIVLNDLASGDAVMIKGSNGVGLAGVVEKIWSRFART